MCPLCMSDEHNISASTKETCSPSCCIQTLDEFFDLPHLDVLLGNILAHLGVL